MKCLYTKPCEVKKPDVRDGYICGASILGYCDYVEMPKEPEPVKLPEPPPMPKKDYFNDQYSHLNQ